MFEWLGTAKKILTVLSWGVLVAFCLTLALGLFVPLYTDEIGAKSQLARVVGEGGRLVSLFPQCAASHTLPLPVSWWPAALVYSALFSGVGLMGLKISALLLAAIWFVVVYAAVARTTADRPARIRRFAAFVAVHAVGVVPFTLVLARSEQTLIVALGAYVAFPFVGSIASRRTAWGRALLLVGFLLLTSIFYFSHPKALLFTPLVLLSLALTFWSRERPLWLVLVLPLVLGTAFQTYQHTKRATACEESPTIRLVFTWITLDPTLALRDPAAFVKAGSKNLRARSVEVAESMSLQPVYASNWLPPRADGKLSATIERVNVASRLAIYGLELATPLLVLASLFCLRARRARSLVLLSVAISAALFVHVFLASHWNFYMSGFVISALAIISGLSARALSLGLPRATLRRFEPFGVATGCGLCLIAIASVAATLLHLGPPLVQLSRARGTRIAEQPASAPIFHGAAERERIRAHAQSCGITGDDATHLVIDDVTLFAFDRLHEPVHLIYVTDAAMWGLDFPGEKNVALLRQLKSPGIISRCSYFPTALVGKAHVDGGYCCVGADDLR